MTILLDMDGVCADFVGSACRAHRTTPDAVPWATCGFDMFNGMGLTEQEFWAPLQGFDFWANLEPYPWLDALLDLCCTASDDVYFCTMPNRDPECLSGKLAWLQQHVPKALQRRYVFTPHKHLLAAEGRVLVDDADHNCIPFAEAGGVAITFPQLWNQEARNTHARLSHVATHLYGAALVAA